MDPDTLHSRSVRIAHRVRQDAAEWTSVLVSVGIYRALICALQHTEQAPALQMAVYVTVQTLSGASAQGFVLRTSPHHGRWSPVMLETLIIVLVILWVLGLVSSYTLGGFIHVLLLFAVIVLVLRLLQGRRI
jgi:hypothetical protein